MTRLQELLTQADLSPTATDWSPGARRLAAAGHPARAAELCAHAIAQGQPLRVQMADYLQQIGFPHQALEQLYLDQPQKPEARRRVFWLAVELGRPDVAFEFLQPGDAEALEECQELRPDARFASAYLHYRHGRLTQAHQQFESLLDLPQWSIWAENMRGLCLYRLGQQSPSDPQPFFHKALEHFDRALRQVEPEQAWLYSEVHFNRACVHYSQGQLARTLEELQTLRHIDPDYPQLEEWLLEVFRLLTDEGAEGNPHRAKNRPSPPPPTLRFARRP